MCNYIKVLFPTDNIASFSYELYNGVDKPASRAWHRLHVFRRLAPVTCFPALGTGYMFSRAWHWLHVFPRLAPVTCFPALGTGYMFSRAWHWLYVFPLLSLVACFTALGTGRMHVPRLASIVCFLFEFSISVTL